MKLRNKKTGEIIEAESCNNTGGCISIYYEEKDGQIGTKDCYTSLAELNEEWEDYEEPEDFWYIEPNGVVARIDEWDCCTNSDIEIMKTLGNYFETREEAEEVVEKLKAWKRLKDAGFKFKYIENNHIEFGSGYIDDVEQFINDMALLFGGEE